MSNYETTYETKSLPLAAAILSLGIVLNSVVKGPEDKSIFVFPHTEDLDQILESFWRKELRIEPNSFWESLRFLKSRIYGG